MQPGSPTIVEPGRSATSSSSRRAAGTFLLADNVEVKEGTQVRINPAALLGYLQVEPLTRPGFPAIKEVNVFKAGTTGYRLIFQHSETAGELIPIAPGTYEVVAKTTEDQDFTSCEERRGESGRDPADTRRTTKWPRSSCTIPRSPARKWSLSTCCEPALTRLPHSRAQFERPLLVHPGEVYDISFKQPGGVTPIRQRRLSQARRSEVDPVAERIYPPRRSRAAAAIAATFAAATVCGVHRPVRERSESAVGIQEQPRRLVEPQRTLHGRSDGFDGFHGIRSRIDDAQPELFPGKRQHVAGAGRSRTRARAGSPPVDRDAPFSG